MRECPARHSLWLSTREPVCVALKRAPRRALEIYEAFARVVTINHDSMKRNGSAEAFIERRSGALPFNTYGNAGLGRPGVRRETRRRTVASAVREGAG